MITHESAMRLQRTGRIAGWLGFFVGLFLWVFLHYLRFDMRGRMWILLLPLIPSWVLYFVGSISERFTKMRD